MTREPDAGRSLSSGESAARYWSEDLRTARKRRQYRRQATVAELDADLAVLRAIARRQRWRRFLFFLFRAFIGVYDERRIDYARAILRSLAIGRGTEVTLTLGLAKTQRAAFRVKWYQGSGIFENPWFEISAPLVTGDHIRIARVEHLEYIVVQTGRRVTRRWTYGFEDKIELRFAAPRAALAPEVRDRFVIDGGCTLGSLEGDASAWRVAFRGNTWWTAPPAIVPRGSVDAVALTLGALESLASVTGAPSAVSSAVSHGAKARIAIVGSRPWAYLLLMLATCAGLWAAVRLHDAQERDATPGGDEQATAKVWREGYASAGVALVLFAAGTCAWVLPPRAGRRRHPATPQP